MIPNSRQLHDGHMKVMRLGLIMNLVVPALMVLGGMGLRNVMSLEPMCDIPSLRLIFWVLIVMSGGDLGAVMFLRKKMLQPNMTELEGMEPAQAIDFVMMRYMVFYVIALSPTALGLVYFMLGGLLEDFVLFGVISLLIYRLVRPKRDFFDSLFGNRMTGVESS